MNMFSARSLVLSFAMTMGLASIAVQAQDRVRGVDCTEERESPSGTLTERTYNRLSNAYEDIGEELYDEAYEALENLLERTRRQDYEQAVIRQAMGHVRMQQERPLEAIEHFERAVELDQMRNEQHFEMVLLIANLYYSEEMYAEALDQLDFWFCLVDEDQSNLVDVWVMKASIHAQADEFREALDAIDRALALADDPREQWYQLKLGMHMELNEYREAIDVLKIVIPMSPDSKNYWIQLSSLHMELDNEEDSKAALKLAYRRGLLDRQTEFVQLASLLQSKGAPRRAAEVMQDGLEQGIVEDTRRHWEMAAGAWYEAREQDSALDAYERAGAQADDGKIDLQRSFILTDLERWEEARDALTRALELGGLEPNERGNAHLLLGMSYFNLGNYDASIEQFDQARQFDRVRQAASEWINHVREERGRRSSR